MDGPDLIETLEDAGLSPYQADAFVTLLELGSASATDLASASSVPDARIYDVLRALEDKGYIETYEQDSLHARAHDPATVLADLRARATRFETAADEIHERWSRPDIEEYNVSIVKRLETVTTRAAELITEATNQVQLGVTPTQFRDLADTLAAAHDRGVNIKVCLIPPIDEGVALPSTETLARTCTEARYRTVPSPFIALVDRSWTCFAPHGNSTNEYGVIVNDRTHTYIFHWFFLTNLWDVQETVYSGRSETFPRTYVDLRRCLRDILPRFQQDQTIEAVVQGFDTTTGSEVEHRGHITDVTYAGVSSTDDASTPLSQLAGEASFTLETGDDIVTVGGWGAMIEDVEAIRIRIDLVDSTPS